MREITLKVPDQKIDFFMNLIDQLGYEVLEETEISEAHKATVRERIKKSNQSSERLLEWDQVQGTFEID